MSAKIIHRELKALPRYIRRNGPLPEPKSAKAVVLPNPFLPWRNPTTGRWSPPKYSLRQQAELIKKAKTMGTVHLLPPGVKLPKPEIFAPPPALKSGPAGKAKATAVTSKAKAKPSTSVTSSVTASESAPRPSKRIARLNLKARRGVDVIVEWDRKPVVKNVPGADKGTRLYAGKKRMFKGSKLERNIPQRAWRTWVLLHDMRKRIRKYRTHYVHKKLNPLKPTRIAAKKLPF